MLFALLSILLALRSRSCAADGLSDEDHERYVTEWCRYNRESAEPAIVLYNRIPKAASTTMISETYAAAKYGGASVINTNHTYWTAKLLNSQPLRDFKKLVLRGARISRATTGVRAVAIGHWYDLDFPEGAFGKSKGGRTFTFARMNLVRNCTERTLSEITYGLAKSQTAALAASSFTGRFLAGDRAALACVANAKCKEGRQVRVLSHKQVTYLAGVSRSGAEAAAGAGMRPYSSVSTDQSTRAEVAAEVLFNGYAVFGLAEALDETLELLACTFPSVGYQYRLGPQHKRARAERRRLESSGPLNTCKGFSCALRHAAGEHRDMVERECANENRELVTKATSIFWARHRAATTSPQKCCRPGRPSPSP